jgi:hypothetical protein
VGSSNKIIAGEFAKDLAIALNIKGITLSAAILLIVHLADDQLSPTDLLSLIT